MPYFVFVSIKAVLVRKIDERKVRKDALVPKRNEGCVNQNCFFIVHVFYKT